MTHPVGSRVRSIFDDRQEGVVIDNVVDGERQATLIEFKDFDEDAGEPYTHRKWLPTRHWEAI